MLNGKRIAVIMPAYNAAQTLEKTVKEFPEIVDIRILVDDQKPMTPWRLPPGWACRFLFTRKITGTAEINRPVTARLWPPEPT